MAKGVFRRHWYPRLRKRWIGTTTAAGGGVSVTPGTATLTLTTFAPTVSTPVLVTPATATLTLTTFGANVVLGTILTPSTASLTLTTFAPSVTTPVLVTPGTASLTLTAFAPTVTGSVSIVITPGTATLVLTTFAPRVTGTDPGDTVALRGVPYAGRKMRTLKPVPMEGFGLIVSFGEGTLAITTTNAGAFTATSSDSGQIAVLWSFTGEEELQVTAGLGATRALAAGLTAQEALEATMTREGVIVGAGQTEHTVAASLTRRTPLDGAGLQRAAHKGLMIVDDEQSTLKILGLPSELA